MRCAMTTRMETLMTGNRLLLQMGQFHDFDHDDKGLFPFSSSSWCGQ